MNTKSDLSFQKKDLEKVYTNLVLNINKPITVNSFFPTLWGASPPEGFIVLWTKTNRFSSFINSQQIDSIGSTALSYDEQHGDVYFAIGMQEKQLINQRGKAETVIALPALWMDIDILNPEAHKRKDLIPSIEEAEKFIAQLPLQPSMIINSGYGLHCYWIFNEPWVFDSDNERQKAVQLSRKFQQSIIDKAHKNDWHIDNTSDLARVLRIPGTRNHKLSEPLFVAPHSQNLNRYSIDELEVSFKSKQLTVPKPVINQSVPLPEKAASITEPPHDSDSRNSQIIYELIDRCAFLKHCKDNAASLSEPEWHKMICILAHEHGGYEAIHEISRPYQKYSQNETDSYILKALQRSNSPITCENLKQGSINWRCNENCCVNSPVHLKQQILNNLGITSNTTAAAVKNDNDDAISDIDLLKKRVPDAVFPWDSFPPYMSDAFKDLSMDMGVQPEMCAVVGLGILSAAVGSVVKSVSVKKGYSAPVNLWIVIIAGTGEKKTPVISRLMKPIHKKQKELVNEYNKLLKEWEQSQKQKSTNDDPEPKLVSLYSTDPTLEALVRLLCYNSHGILLYQDEIPGLLLGFDKYRGGKGGDREQYLSLWNAQPIKIDRVKESFYAPDPYLSIIGGMQPQKTVRLFGEDSFDDGLISRFLFYRKSYISKKVTLHEWSSDYEKYWTDLILYCYSMNRQNKLQLALNDAAKQVFIDYENSLTALTPYVPSRFAVFIPKAVNYVLRISGILHVIESLHNGQTPIPQEISADTVTRAVNLVKFFLSQARQIVELYSPKAPAISMDQKHILESIISIYENRNDFILPTGEIFNIYNNNIPKEAQIDTVESFGKLLVKTLNELKVEFQKERKRVDGRNYQCCIINDKSLKQIKKILNL